MLINTHEEVLMSPFLRLHSFVVFLSSIRCVQCRAFLLAPTLFPKIWVSE